MRKRPWLCFLGVLLLFLSGCATNPDFLPTPSTRLSVTQKPTFFVPLYTPTIIFSTTKPNTPTSPLPFDVNISVEEIPRRLRELTYPKLQIEIQHLSEDNYIALSGYDNERERSLHLLYSIKEKKVVEFIRIGLPISYELFNNILFFKIYSQDGIEFGYQYLSSGASYTIMIERDETNALWDIKPIMDGEFIYYRNAKGGGLPQNKLYSVIDRSLLTVQNIQYGSPSFCSAEYRFCLYFQDSRDVFLLELDTLRMIHLGKMCVFSEFSNECKYSWNMDFSADGLLTYAYDTDTEHQSNNVTVRMMDVDCLIKSNWDIDGCVERKNLAFTIYYAIHGYCDYHLMWVGTTHDLLFNNIDRDNSYSDLICPRKGTWLLSADGRQVKTKTIPGDIQYWFSDNEWAVWDTYTNPRKWGLYSPYKGGLVEDLGKFYGWVTGVLEVK